MKPRKGFSTPRGVMGEAMELLQGTRRDVYFLTMREGRTVEETAKLLNLSQANVEKYRDQAINFVQTYCRAAIDKGRV